MSDKFSHEDPWIENVIRTYQRYFVNVLTEKMNDLQAEKAFDYQNISSFALELYEEHTKMLKLHNQAKVEGVL